MDVSAFFRKSNVWIVAGKGGVGKSTMVAAMARMAADAGLSVLVVELEGRTTTTTSRSAATPEGPIPPGTVQAQTITPDDALLEYLADHGLRRVSKRLVSSGIIDVVASAIPGIRDILVLGKVKQIERSGMADLLLVDAPATGHAMTFLSSASGLLDAARGGPVRTQAAEVVELLTDPDRCQVALVTLPEEMPVNEVVDAAYQLEDKVGIALGPVIVNACYEAVDPVEGSSRAAAEAAGVTLDADLLASLDAAYSFRQTRLELQTEQIDRLSHELPLPQLRAPFVFSDSIGPDELGALAAALAAGVAALPEVDVDAHADIEADAPGETA